jgi:ankyrin repeat protein
VPAPPSTPTPTWSSYSHDGWTALHLAAFFRTDRRARLLLDRGADIDARSKSDRFARERTAARRGGRLASRGGRAPGRARRRRQRPDGSGFTPLALARAAAAIS